MNKLIKNGIVVTASDVQRADVAIENGVVTAVGQNLPDNGAEIVDADGCYVFPGGVDPHTHLDMPFGGTVTIDDFESGTIGFAAGGTTTIVDFCMHEKGKSLQHSLDIWHEKARGKAVIDYGFHMMVGDLRDEILDEIPKLVEEQGVSSFKVFMAYKNNLQAEDKTLFRVLQRAKAAKALVQVHAENGDVIDALVEDALASGNVEPVYHALTRPPEAEGEATARAIELARLAGAPIYIVHVTCREAVEAISRARRRGQPVFGETCEQYLVCDHTDYERPGFEGAKYVMSPPIREKSHQEALWNGLFNGDLMVLGSDQCSFNFKGQKELGKEDFSKIPNGGPTGEERMGILYEYGVVQGRIGLSKFVDLTSTTAAKLFGLFPKKGTIAVGSDADIVIWDPNVERTISAATQYLKCDYSLFEGFKVHGKARDVLLRGEYVFQNNEFVGAPGTGEYVPQKPFEYK
ncbi:dihydropyrimidinase [Alicyclobacillus mengziensis]|uniref:Dihydropyrimidinase n=1 Tax=Alicyclobacillus mengziensis TaxID=2931921 RepID=A0A9X7W252_9BACL|nr:dihydropyrimidinase [Alicyclobacillus mengziensis]QSO49254.1 dihydropyrimidinase [Alicyclobacillus mengziensis]